MANPPFKRRVRYVKPPHYLDRFADADLAGDGDLAALKRQENDQNEGGLGPLFATTFPEPNFGLRFRDKGAGQVSLTETYSGLSITPTFTRATTATTVLANGLIGSVASGTARSYYDPTSLAYLGYLAEGSRINVAIQSEDFSNAAWAKTNVTVTANATTAPDGTLTADKVEATASAATVISQTATGGGLIAGSAYSIFCKQGSGPTDANAFILRDETATTNIVVCSVNYSTGAITYTTGSGPATMKSYPNGWWRLEIAGPAIGNGNNIRGYAGFVGNAETAAEFAYFWGGQLEAGAFASSYMPTTVASFTRNADVLSYGAGILSGSTGTAFAQVNSIASTTLQSWVCGGDNNGRLIFSSTATNYVSQDAALIATYVGNSVVGASRKVAAAWSSTGISIVEGGGTPAASAVGVAAMTATDLQIGHRASANQPYGAISSIAYYRSRLLDADLKRMTGPAFSL